MADFLDSLIDFGIVAGVVFAYVNVGFLAALALGRNDIVDVAWGLGFVVAAWAAFFIGGVPVWPGWLISALVTVWGVRLAWHIGVRNASKREDFRYAAWRRAWGKWVVPRAYLQVWLLQGTVLFTVALGVSVTNFATATINPWAAIALAVVGGGVWLVGFAFESIGDAQLARFKRDGANRGKLMQTGLWRYTRHPNYFGEVVQWWGIAIIALGVPFGWLGLIGALTITFFIVRVSGVPMLERKMVKHPDFEAYSQRTPAFIPRRPRR